MPASNGVAFTGEGKLVRKATGYEQEKAEAALSHIGFAGCASRASGAHWSVSVTHRFLRRGLILSLPKLNVSPTSSSDVRECASGSRKLWAAQHLGAAEVARNVIQQLAIASRFNLSGRKMAKPYFNFGGP